MMKQKTNLIDIVIPYVNNQDTLWAEQYAKYVNRCTKCNIKSISDERVREIFSFKYVFRSIEKHAKFCKNIFLVVQSESQVPSWINRDTVTVVLHEQFIPKELLPTYNSHTIEMFIHKIPGLSNKFVYFNDDMILLKDIYEKDLFNGDIPRDMFYKTNISELSYYYNNTEIFYDNYPNIQMHPHINNTLLALKYNNLPFDEETYYKPNHGPIPLNKNFMEDVYNKYKQEIINNCTQFREDVNTYIYSYRLCNFLKYKTLYTFTTDFIPLKASPSSLNDRILKSNYDCICINDDNYDPNKIKSQIKVIDDCLLELFPEYCKYEVDDKVAICAVCKGRINDLNKWIIYHINLGVSKVVLCDIGGKNRELILNRFGNDTRIQYKVVNNITRAKQRYYKQMYKENNKLYKWIMFIDPDEYVRCKNNISIHLSNIKYDGFDIIKLNRKNMIKTTFVGWDEKVKSIIRGGNKNITFIHKTHNIYHSSSNVPNASSVFNVCNSDGILDATPYYSNCGESLFIERIICNTFQNLINKLSNGILTESLYSQKNFSIIDAKVKLYNSIYPISKDIYEKLNVILGKNLLTEDILHEKLTDNTQDIDFVFPYVDMNDPVWFEEYKTYKPDINDENLFGAARYDGHDLLKYNLRSIEKNMPWIRNVYMIVSSSTQVPKWLDTSKVKIVYHKDFIPNNYLPLFNSSSIEMFLGNLPGLSEKFIYANDDLYVMNKVEPYMFFRGDRCSAYLSEQSTIPANTVNANAIEFKRLGWSIVNESNNIYKLDYFWKPQHCHQAMFKSTCIEVLNKYNQAIINGITKFRENCNCNQYIYTYYNILNKRSFIYKQNNTSYFLSGEQHKLQKLINDIKNNKSDMISIDFNDQVTTNEIDIVHLLLKNKFPNKSKYEY